MSDMRHSRTLGLAATAGILVSLASSPAAAATVCSSVADFNAYMAANATYSDDVTLTFDVVGVNPSDFHNGKGSLAQMRNTGCAGGQDAVIKVYGTADTYNPAHPPGTLKFEYANACCAAGTCGERWAEPNASAVIFTNGSESCKVTMWIKPASVGYKLVCGASTYDGLGENPDKNVVSQIAVLKYLLPGGTTWEIPNATSSNEQVCYSVAGTPAKTINVPVAEDVTVGPTYPTTVFPDVGDLAVEAGDNQAYLKFVVPPSVGKVTNAKLFMHTRTESFANGDGGDVHPVTSSAWSEATLTWNSRPMPGPTSLGHIGPANVNETVSVDLGTAVSGPGTYSFAVVSPAGATNGTHFFSKEGSASDAPYLQLTYEDSDGGAPILPRDAGADEAGPSPASSSDAGSGGRAPGLGASGDRPGGEGSGCHLGVRPSGGAWAALGAAVLALRVGRRRRPRR